MDNRDYRLISGEMNPLAPFRRLGAALRSWLEMADGWVLLPLLLIAVAGPLGEAVDVALFSELEIELLASDLGLEVVTSVLVYGYHLLLMLLGAAAFAALAVPISGDGPIPVRALVSCRPRRSGKIPIR